jgi:hypothetical protein
MSSKRIVSVRLCPHLTSTYSVTFFLYFLVLAANAAKSQSLNPCTGPKILSNPSLSNRFYIPRLRYPSSKERKRALPLAFCRIYCVLYAAQSYQYSTHPPLPVGFGDRRRNESSPRFFQCRFLLCR